MFGDEISGLVSNTSFIETLRAQYTSFSLYMFEISLSAIDFRTHNPRRRKRDSNTMKDSISTEVKTPSSIFNSMLQIAITPHSWY